MILFLPPIFKSAIVAPYNLRLRHGVKKPFSRIPKNYDGTQITTRQVGELLAGALAKIGKTQQQQTSIVLEAWPEIIGPQLAQMAQAVSINNGVLMVKVKNSALHSLLSRHDKHRILSMIQQRFPAAGIKNILFRIG